MLGEKILVVDDEIIIRKLLREILSKDYDILEADNGLNALEVMQKNKVDLVLVDINMPVMNGIEFIHKAVKDYPDAAYIIISGNRDIETAIDALHSGVWAFIQKPFTDIHALQKLISDSMEKKQLLIENRRYKETLEEMVRQRTYELEMKNIELLRSRSRIIGILSRAAEFKDFETGQHFIRVSHYSAIIAKALKMSSEEVLLIKQAAPVHDIGKIGIPESILLKKEKLNDLEIKAMQQHCHYGEAILKSRSLDDLIIPLNSTFEIPPSSPGYLLKTAASIAKNHHERLDGSGYPLGLREDEIPIEAKIVAVADVYDALGSKRPYKEAWPEKECQEYLNYNAGKLFDRNVVDAFLENTDKILEVKKKFSDEQVVFKNSPDSFSEEGMLDYSESKGFRLNKISTLPEGRTDWYIK